MMTIEKAVLAQVRLGHDRRPVDLPLPDLSLGDRVTWTQRGISGWVVGVSFVFGTAAGDDAVPVYQVLFDLWNYVGDEAFVFEPEAARLLAIDLVLGLNRCIREVKG